MKLTGIRALALAGTIGAGAGLSGCKFECQDYLKSQPDVSAGLYDSIQGEKGAFCMGHSLFNDAEVWRYAADSVYFSKKADSAKADTAKKAFASGVDAGKKFILDSIAKAAKAK